MEKASVGYVFTAGVLQGWSGVLGFDVYRKQSSI
jgi:hypothetical protein